MTNRLHTTTIKTILVVEDDELVRLGIITPLRRAGHRILSAADGVEGAMVFARNFDTIDLLLTDAAMPGMDGTNLARFARRIRSDLKIIFASATANLNLHPSSGSPSIDDAILLNKPFTVDELLLTVNAAMGEPYVIPLRAYNSPSRNIIPEPAC